MNYLWRESLVAQDERTCSTTPCPFPCSSPTDLFGRTKEKGEGLESMLGQEQTAKKQKEVSQ